MSPFPIKLHSNRLARRSLRGMKRRVASQTLLRKRALFKLEK
jgi:hypothetical protein